MSKSLLLDKFIQDIDDPLLNAFIQAYADTLDCSDDERLNNLVAKLEELFEEQSNAAHPA